MAVTQPRGQASGKSPEAFRTISEVSTETRFAQIKPLKRGGGRRLYRPDHVALLKGIKALLYDDGLTIKGVQKVLREQGIKAVVARGTVESAEAARAGLPQDAPRRLAALKRRHDEAVASAGAAPAAGAPDLAETDRERVRASIARLEDILRRLEEKG